MQLLRRSFAHIPPIASSGIVLLLVDLWHLPLAGLTLSGTPLGGSGGGGSGSSTPLTTSGLSAPLLGGGSSGIEASSRSAPGVGNNGLSGLLDQLLLLNLLLGLSLRVAVCKLLVRKGPH